MRLFLTTILVIMSVHSSPGNDGYRHKQNIDILNYSFSVTVNDSNDVIYGRSFITIRFTDVTDSIELDFRNIRSDGKGMVTDSVLFSEGGTNWIHKEDKLIIVPDIPVNKGIMGILRIVYHGIPSDGLIISNNKYGHRTFFSDHWPDRARNYLPCIDHPYDKATVDFTIITPAHYEVVASGYPVEESHLKGDLRLVRWREDVPIPVKVMAFGAAQFDIQLAGKPRNIPVWTYVFMENRKEGFYDYSVAVKPLSFFTELIGPYSYEKLANVQSKTIFGGLENAGCIFYSENSVTGKGKAEGLLAHEIAHQWFGNSVTENDWNHIWLSEGFATYLASVYQEMNYDRGLLTESMKESREQVIKYFLHNPCPVIDTTITDLMKLLNPNSYQKGAWVLHMLRYELGEELFWKGMRLFYERFMNKNAVTDDFKEVMEEVSNRDLDTFFKQWLYFAGQPVLKITSNSAMKKGRAEIVIEQTQRNLYSFPLQLLINSHEGSYFKSLKISERITKLTLNADSIKEIIPDPGVNLLFSLIN